MGGHEIDHRKRVEQSRIGVEQCKIYLCLSIRVQFALRATSVFLALAKGLFSDPLVMKITARLSQLDAKR
jgi:hypothetical protein